MGKEYKKTNLKVSTDGGKTFRDLAECEFISLTCEDKDTILNGINNFSQSAVTFDFEMDKKTIKKTNKIFKKLFKEQKKNDKKERELIKKLEVEHKDNFYDYYEKKGEIIFWFSNAHIKNYWIKYTAEYLNENFVMDIKRNRDTLDLGILKIHFKVDIEKAHYGLGDINQYWVEDLFDNNFAEFFWSIWADNVKIPKISSGGII